MSIYLDNAATTPMDPSVFEAMKPYLLEHFGNPSSRHELGRKTRLAIENSRASIAEHLKALPEEIIFTSGGTEADNMALVSSVIYSKINHIITTPFEHHAVLHTLNGLKKTHDLKVSYIQHDSKGNLDPDHLNYLLKIHPKNLVSVMHGNNEIGNLNNIQWIGETCRIHGAWFHTDTVQTMAHYEYDLKQLHTHFLAASAHKFHGPKGIGFLYCRKGTELSPLIQGGGQERALRAGTENIAGIIGLARALEIGYSQMDKDRKYIQSLKDLMIHHLQNISPDVRFNGNSEVKEKSLYTVLSVNLPNTGIDWVSALDEQGIAVSGGSACSAGSNSHVLKALGVEMDRSTIRFSFSRFNTPEEIEVAARAFSSLLHTQAA